MLSEMATLGEDLSFFKYSRYINKTYSFFKKSTSLPTMISEGFSKEMTLELNFA